MFQTFRENFRRHTLLRDAVFIVIGSAIVFNPGAFFQFVGYLIAGYLMLLGLINIYDDYKIKKQTGSWGLGFVTGLIFVVLAVAFLFFAPVIVSILPFLLGISIVIKRPRSIDFCFKYSSNRRAYLQYSGFNRWSCFSFQPLQKSLSFDASLWIYPDFHGCH